MGKLRIRNTDIGTNAHTRPPLSGVDQAEMRRRLFLYGVHVLIAHLGRIIEDTPEHQGVVVFNISDTPLGYIDQFHQA